MLLMEHTPTYVYTQNHLQEQDINMAPMHMHIRSLIGSVYICVIMTGMTLNSLVQESMQIQIVKSHYNNYIHYML